MYRLFKQSCYQQCTNKTCASTCNQSLLLLLRAVIKNAQKLDEWHFMMVKKQSDRDLSMREVMKGRQASDSSPLKSAAGLMTQHRTGPRPLGAVPSRSKAATIAATPPEPIHSYLFLF